MEIVGTVARATGGLLLLGLAAFLLWKGIAMWTDAQSTWAVMMSMAWGTWATFGKVVWSLLLVLIFLPLLLDSGSGLMIRALEDDSPRVVELNRRPGAPNDLILVFHGHNGYGSKLAEVLRPLTDQATVVGFEPSENGYDNEKVIAAALKVIDRLKPVRISAQGESLGGMAIMDLLRAAPELHLHKVSFNATPSRAGYVELGGEALQYADLYPAGVVATTVLRVAQKQALRGSQPDPELGVDMEAMEAADKASLQISGPTSLGELGYMGNFVPPVAGEFVGRVDAVDYLHAPADNDGLVNVKESSTELRRAFGNVFTDVPVAEWMDGKKPLHTPTPRRPSPVINSLRDAA